MRPRCVYNKELLIKQAYACQSDYCFWRILCNENEDNIWLSVGEVWQFSFLVYNCLHISNGKTSDMLYVFVYVCARACVRACERVWFYYYCTDVKNRILRGVKNLVTIRFARPCFVCNDCNWNKKNSTSLRNNEISRRRREIRYNDSIAARAQKINKCPRTKRERGG